MKTRYVFLIMLIFCFSCGTNNKPVSDAQKEKIKGELKEAVNSFIKGIEEADADLVMESFLDSPDFTDITNGMVFSYKDLVAMKPNFDAILNQKCTIVNEKYTFLDKLTVLYTAENTWSTNYKDGHSSITDPQAFLIIFKKIDNRWKVIYLVDSNVEKNIPVESPQGLNQVELMKQFIGTWKCEVGKDTTYFWEAKSYGTGLECYSRYVTKGRVFKEGKDLYGYDRKIDKFIDAELIKGKDIEITVIWFTSNKTYEEILYSNITNPDLEKMIGEFKSPDMQVETYIVNNKPVKTWTYTRVK